MAFTCRPTEKQEKMITALCEYFGTPAKNKAVLETVECYLSVIKERDSYKALAKQQAAELDELKKAVANKFEADRQLFQLIESK